MVVFSFACDNNNLFLRAGGDQAFSYLKAFLHSAIENHCFTKSGAPFRQIIEKAIKGVKFDIFSSRLLTQRMICVILRPCLYEGELSLEGGLPFIPSHVLPSFYIKRVAPVDRVKVELA